MASPVNAGSVLRELRVSGGLSQERLALASGVSVRTIRGLERGVITEPREATIAALAGPLGLRGNDLQLFSRAWRGVLAGPLSLSELMSRHHVVCALTDELEAQPGRLREVIKICESVIDENGRLAEVTVTRTFEALVGGVDRVVWIQNFDPRLVRPGDVHHCGVTNCRTGRTAVLNDSVLGHEMLLDTPIDSGATFLISYRSDFRRAYRDDAPATAQLETESLTGTVVGVAAYVEQVRFTPPRLPVALWQVSQRALPAEGSTRRPLQLSPFAIAQVVLERPHPGVHGIRWSWENHEADPAG